MRLTKKLARKGNKRHSLVASVTVKKKDKIKKKGEQQVHRRSAHAHT